MSNKFKEAPTIETPLASWDQKPSPTMPETNFTAYTYTKVQVEGDMGQRYSSDRLTPLGSVSAPDLSAAQGLARQRWGPQVDYLEPIGADGRPVKPEKRI